MISQRATKVDMRTLRVDIEGMSCGHCVKTVREALESLPGVEIREVVIGQAVVDVDESKTRRDDLVAAIDDTGFIVKSVA